MGWNKSPVCPLHARFFFQNVASESLKGILFSLARGGGFGLRDVNEDSPIPESVFLNFHSNAIRLLLDRLITSS